MSNSIANLLLRNLSDVFGENDPVCRRAAIDEIFHEDAVFYDPKGRIFPVRDEIDHIAGVIKQHIQTSNISPSSLPDAGRAQWYPAPSRQTTRLRGNRFYRPERSHCSGLSLFRQSSLKQKCATAMRSNALLKQLS